MGEGAAMEQPKATVDAVEGAAGRYAQYLAASFRQRMLMIVRRKHVVLAMVIGLAPLAIPLLMAFSYRFDFSPQGAQTFVFLVENIYLKAMAPLLALQFGCMLIAEDVELQMIPYLLTRPIPRSALVLGRFGAYALVVSVIFLFALFLNFAACATLGSFGPSRENLLLLAHYSGVAVVAIFAYGAFTMFIGAFSKRPVVVSIIFLFGWQPFALVVPGAVDFLTIAKYVSELYPVLPTQRENEAFRVLMAELQKEQILVGAGHAFVILIILIMVCVALTTVAVRAREYAEARAAGS